MMLRKEKKIEEPMEVYKEGKSRLVRTSILKEFKTRSVIVIERFKREIPSIIKKPTATYVSPTAVPRVDMELDQYSQDSRRVNPVIEIQLENSENQQEDDKDPKANLPTVRIDLTHPPPSHLTRQ